jgi:hypothetical protein
MRARCTGRVPRSAKARYRHDRNEGVRLAIPARGRKVNGSKRAAECRTVGGKQGEAKMAIDEKTKSGALSFPHQSSGQSVWGVFRLREGKIHTQVKRWTGGSDWGRVSELYSRSW